MEKGFFSEKAGQGTERVHIWDKLSERYIFIVKRRITWYTVSIWALEDRYGKKSFVQGIQTFFFP